MSRGSDPGVSVCIPAFNTAEWIERAIQSVLEQTHEDFELIVVDDASTDSTLQLVKKIRDPRLRVYANPERLGHSGNWNRSIELARGGLIKLLCSDDVLYPSCLAKLIEPFMSSADVGLAFSTRDVELDDPADPRSLAWEASRGRTHAGFGKLDRVNSGKTLFRRWMRDGFGGNLIGEPTNVMVSRECLRRVGGFSHHIHQRADMDLWIRATFFFDVGFVDEPLAAYLVRSNSITQENLATGRAWLDNLWLVEGLLSYEEIRGAYPELRALRSRRLREAARHALRRTAGGDLAHLPAARTYLAWRLGSGRRSREPLAGDPLQGRGRPLELG